MTKLNELLTNEDCNVWVLFKGEVGASELREIVKAASKEDLKALIVKFDDHQLFAFMEDFITDGENENMSEDEYWDFIEEAGL